MERLIRPMSARRAMARCLILSLAVLAAWSAPARATAPRIEQVILTEDRDRLAVAFNLVNGLAPEEMAKALRAGVPISITYEVELLEIRPVLPTRRTGSAVLKRTIQLNPVTAKYAITNHGPGPARITALELEEAKRLISTVEGLVLSPMAALAKDTTYRVRARALIHPPPVPDAVGYILLFGPRDIETDWAAVEIRP